MRKFCCVLILPALLLGCQQQPHAPGEKEKADATPAKVKVIAPTMRALTRRVEQPGSIQPDEQTRLYARIPGYVGKMHADIGLRIKAGDVLCELSAPELVAEGEEKEARVKHADAEVEQSRKALAAAAANVEAVGALVLEAKAGVSRAQALLDRWESENRRVADLVKRGVVDAQTRDETRNQHRAAQASFDEARARVASAGSAKLKAEADRDKAQADVAAAEAKREVSRAESKRLKALLEYRFIRAPFAGRVTSRDVNTGDFVQPGGQVLFGVAKTDPARAVVQVPEADAGLVTDGLELSLTIQALGERVIRGKVARTSWVLSAGSRTLRVEVDLPNADGTYRPGMYAYATFESPLPEAWTVPASAVARLGDVVAVFRVEGGKAVMMPVQLGHTDGAYVQVRRWQKPGTPPAWVAIGGEEKLAEKAAGLFDGRGVEAE